MAGGLEGLVTGLGDLTSYRDWWYNNSYLMWGAVFVNIAIGFEYIQGKIDTVHWLYMGTAFWLTLELCIAGFMAYKIVDATIVSSQLLYATYKGYSIL